MPETIDVARLVATYEARTSQFERALKRIEGKNARATRGMRREFGSLNRSIGTAAATLKGFAGIALGGVAVGGVASLPGVIKSTVSEAAGLVDTANKIGLTTRALQELQFAGENFSISTNTMNMAMQRFSRRVGEAVQGSGELKATLDQYNIEVKDSSGRTRELTDVLGDLANVIMNAESDQERLRIAFKAFDSEGAAMVNILRQGEAGLDKFTEAARKAGAVMDSDTLAAAKRLDEQFTKLTKRIETAGKSLIVNWVAGIQDFADNFRDINDLKTDDLERRLERLTNRINEMALSGQHSARVMGQAFDEARKMREELDRRAAAARGPFRRGGNPHLGFGSGAPIVRDRPDTPEFHNTVIRLQDQLAQKEQKRLEIERRRNETIDGTIKRLQMELSLVGKSSEQRRAAQTLAGLNIAADDPRRGQIEGLIAQIETRTKAIDALEEKTLKVRDAANEAGRAIGGMFDLISGKAELTTENVLRLGAAFIQLGQQAQQNGGSFSVSDGASFGAGLFGAGSIIRG